MQETDNLEKKMKLESSVLLYNAFVLGCFTVLAIFFQLWWVVLFSVLFLRSVHCLIYERKDKE